MKNEAILCTGRRKNAVARVHLRKGGGETMVNGKQVEKYFTKQDRINLMFEPLKAVSMSNDLHFFVRVNGGGKNGQAGAIRLGIARCLVKYDEEKFRAILSKSGFLTRDPRMVERKKPGRPKARKSFQFSKR